VFEVTNTGFVVSPSRQPDRHTQWRNARAATRRRRQRHNLEW
jgi:hypothetical protein